jgi:hypothetical protein
MLILFLSYLFMSRISFAYDEVWDWTPVKSLGMGRAFSTFGSDLDAIVNNPAGIAKSRNPRSRKILQHLDVPQISVSGNNQGISSLRKAGFSQYPKKIRELAILNQEPQILTVQIFPNVTLGTKGTPTFFFGTFLRSYDYIEKSKTNPLETFYTGHKTYGFSFGIADSFFNGRLSYGVLLRPNIRYALETKYFQEEDSSTTKKFFNSIKSKGAKSSALPIDAGLIYTHQAFWLPSVGVSIKNISPIGMGCLEDYLSPLDGEKKIVCGILRKGGDKISYGKSNLDPFEMSFGAGVTPRTKLSGEKINLRLSTELSPVPLKFGESHFGLYSQDEADNFAKLVSFGGELFFGKANINRGFGLRAGYAKQDLTFGATLAIGGVIIDYSNYAAKVYAQSGFVSERRQALSISTDW